MDWIVSITLLIVLGVIFLKGMSLLSEIWPASKETEGEAFFDDYGPSSSTFSRTGQKNRVFDPLIDDPASKSLSCNIFHDKEEDLELSSNHLRNDP